MKPTLLLIALLIGMVGSAQKQTAIDSIFSSYKMVYPDTLIYYGACYSKVKETACNKPDYVTELLEYEKKCQNDSTYQLVYPELPQNGMYTLAIWIEPSHQWVKTRPTFEGFIEFVKNKYKQK